MMRHVQGGCIGKWSADPDLRLLGGLTRGWLQGRVRRLLGETRANPPRSERRRAASVSEPALELPAPHPARWLDIQMMVMLGGRERTEAEFRALLSKADFELSRIVPTPSPVSILECSPRG